MKSTLFLRSLLKGLSIYSLLLWVYIVLSVLHNPGAQYFNLSVYVPVRQNLLAIVAFAVSFLCFIGWQYLEKTPS
jgi:hypothetical protein